MTNQNQILLFPQLCFKQFWASASCVSWFFVFQWIWKVVVNKSGTAHIVLSKLLPSASLCVQSFSCVQFFATLWTVAHQAPLSMEFSRQEYWSGLPFPSPGDLPDPGTESASPVSLALQVDSSESPSMQTTSLYSSTVNGRILFKVPSPLVLQSYATLHIYIFTYLLSVEYKELS